MRQTPQDEDFNEQRGKFRRIRLLMAACSVPTAATVEGPHMRIVRRSHSGSSTTPSGLGIWGGEVGCTV